ncbi:hypothetical protein [Kitasatospora sp. NPDC056181]|uniref:hypothetical protein n=1 Tax=Kitasatospora sp. NPDC056181 TaxID=3345737 RepID=UPI0035D75ACB
MKTLTRRTVTLLLDTVFGFLNSTVKTVAALAVVGLDRVVDPVRVLPNHTGLVITLGVLAALDALAWFGVMPERCTADQPCDECLRYVEANGFYPYGATPTGIYTEAKEIGQ